MRLLTLSLIILFSTMSGILCKPSPDDLIRATKKRDIVKIEKLIQKEVVIDYINSSGEAALFIAASKGYFEVLEILIKNNAKIF